MWTEACQAAFCELKRALVAAPVLATPYVWGCRGFIPQTDYSAGLGAILSQKQDNGEIHPIAYATRS